MEGGPGSRPRLCMSVWTWSSSPRGKCSMRRSLNELSLQISCIHKGMEWSELTPVNRLEPNPWAQSAHSTLATFRVKKPFWGKCLIKHFNKGTAYLLLWLHEQAPKPIWWNHSSDLSKSSVWTISRHLSHTHRKHGEGQEMVKSRPTKSSGSEPERLRK